MQEFKIVLRSFEDVQDFVSLATVQPFPVLVENDQRQFNAKGFMGMLTLDHRTPLLVCADCSDEEFRSFLADAQRFLP